MTNFTPENWAALSPLLDEALELPASQRAAWLAAQRIGDPILAAQLEEVLGREAHADQDGFLTERLAPDTPPVSSLTGQELAGYRLERPLGQGGMGSVWLGRRSDGRFEGVAAIKFLNLAVAGPAGEGRFRREGSVLARLTHTNIARLMDAGVTPAGQPYLVLEYIDGQRLDTWCDARRLSVEERLRLFLQVLKAVSHAHANFIVHRDLKPANILVTGDGVVKLLDFGIAKLIEEGAQAPTALTRSNEVVLTFEYAAPEQVRGDPVTAATDVYGLGVVLYQLLAGRHPTSADCHTPAEHVMAILDTNPGQLSRSLTPSATLPKEEALRLAAARDASPERLQRIFAGDLDNVLAKALRKNPIERYATVAGFGDDLSRYLAHEPVSARPDAWSYRVGRFLRRHRAAVSAAVLVVLILVGATIMTSLQAAEARRQRDEALREVKRQHAMNAVQTVLASDSRGADGRQLTTAERIGLALQVLRRQFGTEPWLVAEVMADLSGRFYETGDRESQRNILADAERLARNENLPAQAALASCLRVYSFAYDDVFDSANADLAAARSAMARSPALPEATALLCLDAEGALLVEEGKPDSAITLLTQVAHRAEAATATGALVESDLLQFWNDLAQALRAGGRTREASQLQLREVARLDSTGYGTTDILPNVFAFLASSLSELGEFDAVKDAALHIVREQEAVDGVGHPSTVMGFLLGNSYLRVGENDSAEAWFDRVIRDTTQGAGGISVWYTVAMTQLRLDQHRPAEARRILANLPSGSHGLDVLHALYEARLRWEEHDSVSASRGLEAAIRQNSGTGSHIPADLTVPLLTAGEWRLALHDARGADSLARRAREVSARDSLALTRSGLVGRAELLLSRALRAEQDSSGARDAAGRAVVALSVGNGEASPLTREAKALLDSLQH